MMVSYDDVERLLDYGRESRHMMVSYDDVERRLNVAVRQKNWSASSNVAGRQKNWSASSKDDLRYNDEERRIGTSTPLTVRLLNEW